MLFPALHASAGRGSFQPIDSSSGLSDLVVNSIFKDSQGFVWLGTGLSLARFDGNNVLSIPIPGENLNAKRVKAIAEGPNHEIYIGNASGLFVYHSRQTNLESVLPDRINMSVNALVSKSDTLFVATDAGLFAFDLTRRKLSRFLLNPNVMTGENVLTAMHLMPDGDLWIASSHGISRFDPVNKQYSTYHLEGTFAPTSITAMGDTLFIGTYGGGVIPCVRNEQRFLSAVNVGNDIVTDITFHDRNLVVATDGTGIFVCNPHNGNIIRHYHVEGGENMSLRSNSVYAVMADEKGLLWVGYYQDGADYTLYNGKIFEVYNLPNANFTTLHRAVRAVAVDGDYLLIGTREGLIYVNNSTGEVCEFKSPRIRSNIIFCISKWRGKFYIGTYNGGMYVFDPATKGLTEFSPRAEFGDRESVFTITKDSANNLWIAASSGVYVLDASGDRKSTRLYTHRNSRLPEGNVYEIFFDSTGRGWICTENGVAVWDGTMLRTDGFPKNFINTQKIRDIYEDKDHNLYFLPDRGDIYRSNLELTEFRPLDNLSKATNRTATFICADADGMLWVGSEMGLVRFDDKENLRYFSQSDGLPSKVFTMCSPVVDENSDMWFGTNQGLVRLDLTRLHKESSMKRLPELTEMLANGINVTDRLRPGKRLYYIDLESDENNLNIAHANFDYILPDDQIVEYMLEGYDKQWNMKTGQGRISYFNLPSGQYHFHIRLAGDPTTATGYDIHVRPSVNILAVILSVVGFLAICAAVYFYLMHRRQREETTMLHQLESDRIEAADRKAREDELRRYKSTRLSDEECKRLHRKLEAVMRSERPFTNANLKSGELAAMIGTTAHALSFLFNQYLHKNYYDYVNEYRVNEFKRLVSELDTSRYTLTAMSQMCGFSSRASFFRHFKNITGITPADYLKSIKK